MALDYLGLRLCHPGRYRLLSSALAAVALAQDWYPGPTTFLSSRRPPWLLSPPDSAELLKWTAAAGRRSHGRLIGVVSQFKLQRIADLKHGKGRSNRDPFPVRG